MLRRGARTLDPALPGRINDLLSPFQSVTAPPTLTEPRAVQGLLVGDTVCFLRFPEAQKRALGEQVYARESKRLGSSRICHS